MKNLIHKLLNSRIANLFVPLITWIRRKKNRKKLKNDSFTILCSNCTGGIIYHELNKRFLSPTINLRISSKDFVKFLLNIDDYINKDLDFFKSEENCPCAHLGDIVIYFTHYDNQQDAEEKWRERIKRINWKNVYVILNDRDGVTHDDIKELLKFKCKNMVVFTSHMYYDCPNAFYMPQFKGQECVGYTLNHLPITGEWFFERFFDYVGWLNSDNQNCEDFRK